MEIFMRNVVRAILFGLVAASASALAQDYPNKPIRLIVPFGTGGATDTSGRLIADALGKRLNERIVVENRGGAGGNIGADLVAKAPADGYTLLLALDATMVVNPFTTRTPFDTLKDFAPITKLGNVALVLAANPGLPAKNFKELLAYSKANPGKLSYSTGGTGSTSHVGMELLKQRTGLDMLHVPYKSGGLAVLDAVSGVVQLTYPAVAGANTHIRSGKLAGIGVSTRNRVSTIPDTPTFIEQGLKDFEVVSWVALMAPAGTPPAVINRLHAETVQSLKEPTVRQRFETLGIEPVGNTPEQFAAEIRADLARWKEVVERAGIKVD
jgi:tripartite-type tricarboxylate transporter receptor subunit TctC